MNLAFEKIDLRIILLCKKNNLNFKKETIDKQVVYLLDDFKLGFIRFEVNFDNDNNVSNIFLYGNNETLLSFVNSIENNRRFFDLPIIDYGLIRTDYIHSTLKVVFDKLGIQEFEKLNKDDDSYNKNMLLEKVETHRKSNKLAYDDSSIDNKKAIAFFSKNFFRPEAYFIKDEDQETPDANGNINCYYCVNCKNCVNCIGCIDCENCYNCTNCHNCFECDNSNDLGNCENCHHCIECLGCSFLFACDGLIARNNIGSYCLYSDGDERLNDYKIFPESGCIFYHDRIEAFFLSNRFIPYKRPYVNASNYNWSIQWHISRNNRRYWITDIPSEKYQDRIYSFTELSTFFLLNKLKIRNWEISNLIKEYFNIVDYTTLIDNPISFLDDIHIAKQPESLTMLDEIFTKPPLECIFKEFTTSI